jgi:GxxExxY protein
MDNFKHKFITEKILKAYYNVYNSLGFGFLEKVYEKALLIELQELGLTVESQKQISVYYKHKLVGNYFADIIVEEKVILELKAAEFLFSSHSSQLYNYLKSTEIEVGLILNFGEKPEFKRIVFTNDRKINLNQIRK